MHPKTAARRAALKVLVLLEERDVNFAQALNEYAAFIPASTRGFARELASGVLRHRSRLDWTLAPLLKKPLEKLDTPVRAALRLCCYERTFLKTPPPVAGNEYSAVLRREKLSSAAGLLTAIARRLPDAPRAAPPCEANPARHFAVEYSHPQWLVERWLERFGADECEKLLAFNNTIAPLALRVNTCLATRDEVLRSLQARDLNVRVGAHSPDAIIVENAGDPTAWPEWNEGVIIAQDEGAQLVARFAHPLPGQYIIDACAAPGGKSTHLAQLMNNEGKIIACDFPGRIKLVRENAERLKMEIIETREGDFLELSTQLAPADLVLLDVPCLGTGTLRRRPDAKWKKTSDQLCGLLALQRELLAAAARVVKPNGFLVYSTCSIEPEENEEQVENFLRENPDWRLEGTMSTLPHRDRCDGAFAAKLRRSDR
jgi:16S rRNA (cytosine967-C5)-methyltransferase